MHVCEQTRVLVENRVINIDSREIFLNLRYFSASRCLSLVVLSKYICICVYVNPCGTVFPNYTINRILNTSMFFVSRGQIQHLCHILASVFYFFPLLVSPVYFPNIFNCIIFKAKVASLGQTAMKNIKITFFFAPNVKKEMVYRRNYKALDNKVNHCGRMPGVDKWRDRNVSTTSAICFLCCEFFSLLRPHCFLSLCFFCHISLLTLLFSFLYTVCFSFFLSISVSFSLSLSPAQLSQ